jgi:hypothetical protein
MRNSRQGSIQAAVRNSISVAGGLECVSNDLGMSVSNLSRASDDDEDRPGGLGVNHLHRLGRIIPASAEPLARHFAGLAGGAYIPLPHADLHLSDLYAVMKEFSDVVDLHARAHSPESADPKRFTPEEARTQIAEIGELVQAALIYEAALKDNVAGGDL